MTIEIDNYQFVYSPSIKTTDAEIKGYRNLSTEVKDSILPLMELTKSRIHARTNPIGSIFRRAESLKDILEGRPFILDLTVHPDLQTPEIESLLLEENGYENWRDFLAHVDIPNVIPVVHATVGGDENQLVNQSIRLQADYGNIAIRISLNEEDIEEFVRPVFNGLGTAENCIIVLDAGFIAQRQAAAVAAAMSQSINAMIRLGRGHPKAFIPIGSSFPRMVAQPGYGVDEFGEFRMEEWLVYTSLRNSDIPSLMYGDYATIHPVRYLTRGGNWVPRVDAPLGEKFKYHRKRRDEGGYIFAASQMLQDAEYISCDSWGDNEIALAAIGNPSGRNPSHWISVRENIHITRRVQMLSP